MKKNEKQEAKHEDAQWYDFSKVMLEVNIGEFEEIDLSHVVGNNIHRLTSDIYYDELARKIYKDGKVLLSESDVRVIKLYINSDRCDMNIGAREACNKLLTLNS